jgi:hypothetical protein
VKTDGTCGAGQKNKTKRKTGRSYGCSGYVFVHNASGFERKHIQSIFVYDFTYQVFGDVVVEEAPGVNVEITIPEGTSTMELASKLEMNRLVVNRYSFYIKVKLLNYKILAGTYHLNTSMTYDDIINTITNYANAIEPPAGEENK